jgi:hypothetical protein
MKHIKTSLESTLHLPSGYVWNVTLTLLSSLDTLQRTLSASTLSGPVKTLYHNSTLPSSAEIHSLRYFIMLDGIYFTEAGIVSAITTASLSGALASTIKMSDPSLSGIYLSGPPSFTTESRAPPVKPSDESTQIPSFVWIVIGLIPAPLILCCAAYLACCRSPSTIS